VKSISAAPNGVLAIGPNLLTRIDANNDVVHEVRHAAVRERVVTNGDDYFFIGGITSSSTITRIGQDGTEKGVYKIDGPALGLLDLKSIVIGVDSLYVVVLGAAAEADWESFVRVGDVTLEGGGWRVIEIVL
jgi:hypothetical protein